MGLWALWLITQYKIQAFTGLISLEDIISLCIIKFHSSWAITNSFFLSFVSLESFWCYNFSVISSLKQSGYVWIASSIWSFVYSAFLVGLVHYLQDLQVLFFIKITLKLGLTVLFTHLKIILQHCFQFSVISGIQTDP